MLHISNVKQYGIRVYLYFTTQISNRKRLLVLHVFCDYFDLVFYFSFYKIYKYTKINTKIPTNKTANNNKKLKKY